VKNLDDSEDLSPGEAHLAAVWPLGAGEQVTLHGDKCPIYRGDDDCRCKPLRLVGPTAFA
jgi:hypothetical protein